MKGIEPLKLHYLSPKFSTSTSGGRNQEGSQLAQVYPEMAIETTTVSGRTFIFFLSLMVTCCFLVFIVAASGDQPNNGVSAATEDDGEFADFASFQTSSLPSLAPRSTFVSNSLPKTEANGTTFGEVSTVANQHTSSSLELSSTGGSDKYQMIKDLISNTSLYTSGPPPASGELTEHGNGEWSDYHGLSQANVIRFNVDPDFRPLSAPDDGDWADFQGTSVVVSDSDQAVHTSDDTVPSSLPELDIDRLPVKAKSSTVANYSTTASLFVILQNDAVNSTPSRALFSSGALDFSPPELPPENDDEDTNYLGFGNGGQGISSLSTLDLEDETMDSVRSGGGLMKSITTSNSTSSFEFTGWRQGSKHSLPVPRSDNQSTSSLDLRPAMDSSNDSQPMAEADSQSESSLEFFPPSETRLPISGFITADFDAASLHSLELKTTVASPEEEPSSGVGIGLDDTTLVGSHSMSDINSVQTSSGMSSSCS